MIEEGAAIGVASAGGKPAIVVVDTMAMTAEITAIDAHSHRVTLELPNGTIKTVKVGKHIDLTRVSLGDAVFIQVSEGVAIEVVKPS